LDRLFKNPMKIIQIGMEKSGNLWLWRIIENILSRSGFEKKSFVRKQPIYDLMKDWKATISKWYEIDAIAIHKKSLSTIAFHSFICQLRI